MKLIEEYKKETGKSAYREISMYTGYTEETYSEEYTEWLENKIKNLGESSSRLSAVSGGDSGWISVNDRLPMEDELFGHNNSGNCWIKIDDGDVQIGSYYDDNEDSFDDSGFSHSGVTHWMPLIKPEPTNHGR